MNNFQSRSITGLIYVLVIAGGILIHPFLYAIVFGGLLVFALNEFYSISKFTEATPQKIPAIAFGLISFVLFFGYCIKLWPLKLTLVLAPLFLIIALIEIYRNKEKPLQNVAISMLGLIYIALPFVLINFILFPGLPGDAFYSPLILMGIFIIIWVNDSFAFLFGRWLGKHKLFERISPKKTWEGAIGGGIFALIASILNSVVFQSLELISWMVVGLIIVVFGTFGDLFESTLKRSLNIKDSGKGLPGHGGILDRIDSLLFVIPFIFVWLLIFNTPF